MTSNILKSLITLFTISINKNEETNIDNICFIFNNFLETTIEEQYWNYYKNLFIEALDTYNSTSLKKLSSNSVKLLKHSIEIANNLSKTDRLKVAFYLYYLFREIENNFNSAEYIALTTEIFGIENSKIQIITDFVNNNPNPYIYEIKHNDNSLFDYINLKNECIIIKSNCNDLKINNININKENFYFLDTNSVITYKYNIKYFPQDLVSDFQKDSRSSVFNLYIKDIEVLRKDKVLLQKLSLKFSSGELVGIIGKSGSGKTTLLKTIAGIEKNYFGTIQKNEKICGYVTQNNYFIPLFSIKEHLEQRMNFLQVNRNKIDEKYKNIIKAVNLQNDQNKIAINTDNSPCQLSGGQLKRLAIAMELVANPDVLLLDEPTSGLASNDSMKIISLLKEIAVENRIVIAAIHQPDYEMLMMFDKILIIDEGYTIFFDKPSKAFQYFREINEKIDKNSLVETYFNPSLILNLINDIVGCDENENQQNTRKLSPEYLYNKFIEQQNNVFEKIDDKPQNNRPKTKKIKSLFSQLTTSLKIDYKNKIRLSLLLFVPLLIGVLFSASLRYSNSDDYVLYNNPNIPVWTLIIFISAIFIGLISSAHEYIFLRHYNNSENRLINKQNSLFWSKILKYFIYSLVQTLILIIPSVLILKIHYGFYSITIIVWLLMFYGNSISLFLSMLFKNTSTVYLIIPLIIIPQMIFSGAMIEYSNFNNILKNEKKEVPTIADFVPVRWASEAIITDLYLNNDYEKNLYTAKRLFFEAIYYLDYVIPEIQTINETNPDKAVLLLNNEFAMKIDKQQIINMLDTIKTNFTNQKLYTQELIDNIQTKIPKNLFLSQTNKSINSIISGRNKKPFVIINDKFYRKYIPAYHSANSLSENSLFLIGEKHITHKYKMPTIYYNISILLIFNILMVIFLWIFILNYQRTQRS